MSLRMLIDGDAVDPHDVALVGGANLDPPEVEFIAAGGSTTTSDAVLAGSTPSTSPSTATSSSRAELTVFMPEPGGPTLAELERQLGRLREGDVVGAGFTGLTPDPANVEKLERLSAALGFKGGGPS